jgi:hypothetical protein
MAGAGGFPIEFSSDLVHSIGFSVDGVPQFQVFCWFMIDGAQFIDPQILKFTSGIMEGKILRK